MVIKKNISINLPLDLIDQLKPISNRSQFIEQAIRLKFNEPTLEEKILSLLSNTKPSQPIQIPEVQKNKAPYTDALSSIISMRE